MLRAAAAHRGTAFVEIYQNCNIFNDGAFELLKDPGSRDEAVIRLEHGRPVRVGVGLGQGVVRDPASGALGVAEVSQVGAERVLVHDAHADDPSGAFALARLTTPGGLARTCFGVFRDVERPTYGDLMASQLEQAAASSGSSDLGALLRGKDTWTVV